MPVTESGMAADIEAKLNTYFGHASGNDRPDFAALLAGLIKDAIVDGINSYTVASTTTNTVPAIVSPAGPCTGTVAATSTTTLTCTIP